MATETLSGAEKMRLVPGIYFGTEPAGRYAKIDGAGIDDWLSAGQLDAALKYYAHFLGEIDARIALEEALTPEFVYATYPFMRP